MKLEIKSFIIGVLLTVVFVLSIAAVQEHRIHGFSQDKILIKDSKDNLLIVDMKTTMADWVEYNTNNPAKNPITVKDNFQGNN